MAIMLGQTCSRFADGCNHRVPLYGCSAFEYIQYLHVFLENMPEGPKYQYVCGRTDIQAAHMCGYQQPDGKCVLFINDVYGAPMGVGSFIWFVRGNCTHVRIHVQICT